MKEQHKISSRSHSKKTFLVGVMFCMVLFMEVFVSATFDDQFNTGTSLNTSLWTTNTTGSGTHAITGGLLNTTSVTANSQMFATTKTPVTYSQKVTTRTSPQSSADNSLWFGITNQSNFNALDEKLALLKNYNGGQAVYVYYPNGTQATTGWTMTTGTYYIIEVNYTAPNAQLCLYNDNYSSLIGCSSPYEITWDSWYAGLGSRSGGGLGASTAFYDWVNASDGLGIEINSPDNNTEFLINQDFEFNVTSQTAGSNLVNISLYIDNILNETINISGTTNTTIFTKSFNSTGSRDYYFQSCNEALCINSTQRTLTISSFTTNSVTYNAQSYETATDDYVLDVNVSSGSSLSNGKIVYDGTEYSATITNTGTDRYNISAEITHAAGSSGIKTFHFEFDIDSSTQTTSDNNQTLQLINFAYCTNGTTYLNVTFKDEETLSFINASIPTSTFDYYLGDGTAYKTLTYTNTTELPSYSFCFNVTTQALFVDMRIQYEASGYPQRVYDPMVATLTNSTTNTTLYLLATSGNQYVTIQFINSAEQTLTGVEVTATRSIGGSDVVVSQGTSDASGSVTFFLNPDFTHTFTYSLSGYTTLTQSFAPTQTSYTVTLSSSSISTSQDYADGMTFLVSPTNITLTQNNQYTFGFMINSSLWSLDSFGFVFKDENGTVLSSNSSTTTTGGTLVYVYNVSTNSELTLDYFWEVNNTFINGSRTWYIISDQGTDWSLLTAINNTRNTLNSGIFGATTFTMAIIAFLTIFLIVGIMSWKFGLTSPAAISAMTFVLVALFDVGFGMFGDFKLAGAVPNIPTIFVGIITLSLFFWEVNR